MRFLKKIIIFILFFCFIIFIFSCSSTKKISESTSQSSSKNDYTDEEETIYELGLASYYSSIFEGRATASGEIYAGSELTAAHKRLPFGTIVKVRNLKNNKIVTVRINDRGPTKADRVIDLSYKAAEILDMIKDGIVKVEIIIIKK
jgi:rare lipoprotein A